MRLPAPLLAPSTLAPRIESPVAVNHLFIGHKSNKRNRHVTDAPRIAHAYGGNARAVQQAAANEKARPTHIQPISRSDDGPGAQSMKKAEDGMGSQISVTGSTCSQDSGSSTPKRGSRPSGVERSLSDAQSSDGYLSEASNNTRGSTAQSVDLESDADTIGEKSCDDVANLQDVEEEPVEPEDKGGQSVEDEVEVEERKSELCPEEAPPGDKETEDREKELTELEGTEEKKGEEKELIDFAGNEELDTVENASVVQVKGEVDASEELLIELDEADEGVKETTKEQKTVEEEEKKLEENIDTECDELIIEIGRVLDGNDNDVQKTDPVGADPVGVDPVDADAVGVWSGENKGFQKNDATTVETEESSVTPEAVKQKDAVYAPAEAESHLNEEPNLTEIQVMSERAVANEETNTQNIAANPEEIYLSKFHGRETNAERVGFAESENRAEKSPTKPNGVSGTCALGVSGSDVSSAETSPRHRDQHTHTDIESYLNSKQSLTQQGGGATSPTPKPFHPFQSRPMINERRAQNGLRLGLYSPEDLGLQGVGGTGGRRGGAERGPVSSIGRAQINACLHRQYMAEVKQQAKNRKH